MNWSDLEVHITRCYDFDAPGRMYWNLSSGQNVWTPGKHPVQNATGLDYLLL